MDERQAEIEKSIVKKFKKTIWHRFVGALKDYELINEGDKVAVCISGGKDSMLLAKCVQELKRRSKVNFDAEFIVMNPGYNKENIDRIVSNAEIMGIPIRIFDANIFNYVYKQEGSPCYLCARMRRGYLYKEAQSLGCNKIALGHHFNDVIETTMLNMMYGAQIKTMLPKLRSTNYAGMELIRPLYLIREEDIIAWARYNSLSFIQCACRFTEQTAHGENISKRKEMKELIEHMKQSNPAADLNIFRSLHNVNLSQIVSFRESDGIELVSFPEKYNSDCDNSEI
ncbi:MAG: tRNA 2-thiocytidine biosynthesis protein TtcA [Oscillospiraceae bacterium]|nr:tRNA 2-thiocytidine biosynthesis protein TtcA [Oscillospiraceae bacterium]